MREPETPAELQLATLTDSDFSMLVECLPYPAWLLGERGELRRANAALIAHSGCSQGELADAGWQELIHADDRTGFAAQLERALASGATSGPSGMDVRLRGRNDEHRWHALTVAPLPKGGAAARWLVTATDAHERKLEEIDLREREARFRLLADTSNDGAFYWDCRTNYVYWTDRQLELLGATRDEWDNSMGAIMELVHPDDRVIMENAVRAHLEQRAPYAFEMRLRHTKTGEYRTCQVRGQAEWDENGAPVRMGGGLADITDRRRMEQALREQLDIIEQQREAISKLSAPVIEVWDRVVTMPLLGGIDVTRAAEMMERLLHHVVKTGCSYAIIDLTGLDALDTGTAENIIRMVHAVQLLGAQGIVVGIRPEAAQTLVSLGVDLSSITTLANLRQALEFAMRGGIAKRGRDARGEAVPAPRQKA